MKTCELEEKLGYLSQFLIASLSGVVDSTELYERAITRLAKATQIPDWEQAELIGFETYFAVMEKSEEIRWRR